MIRDRIADGLLPGEPPLVTASSPTPLMMFCPHCAVEIPAEATVCPHCQGPLDHATATTEPRRDSLYQYLDNRWLMLGMLFFVTAGLGLPFLWKSRAFGLVGKTVLTMIMIAYTALILWLIALLLVQIAGNLEELWRSW